MLSVRHGRLPQILSIVLCVGLVASCSSKPTSSAVTTSTSQAAGNRVNVPPAPPNAASIAAYLEAAHNAVLAFEQATVPLGSGSSPSESTCQTITRRLGEDPDTNPSAVQNGVRGIANTAIQIAVSQDIQAKLLLLSTCTQGRTPRRDELSVDTTSAIVDREFAQLGISLR